MLCHFSAGPRPSSVSLKGRLKACIRFWTSIGVYQTAHEIISNGYCIPFTTDPPNIGFKNNSSAIRNQAFIESEIENLFQSNRISEVFKPPCVVNPLLVSMNPDGSNRLILHLSVVNHFKHFKG